jgi:hypothetical protein
MRSLEKRLSNLEQKFHRDVITLEMADGSTETLVIGSGDGLIDLFGRSMWEMQAGTGFSRDVDMVRRSIGGTEKGGHMIELTRALLQSPMASDEYDAIG